MQVRIDSIDQRMMLNQGNEVATSLTLALPNGQKVSVSIQPEAAEIVLKAGAGGGASAPAQPPVEVMVPRQPSNEELEVFGGSGVEAPEEEMSLEWAALTDDVLPQAIKDELTRRGMPPELPLSELSTLADQISAELMERAKRQQQPQVQRLQVSRPRTVPKDEMGYPIVPQRVDRDPGELGPGAHDEDGVPQA